MSNPQTRINELHRDIQGALQKKKDLTTMIKDAYLQTKEYQDILEEVAKQKARQKEVELAIREQYSSEYNQLEDIKLDVKDMKMVLSDLMWNELLKSHTVEVVDQYENRYIPNVVVTLKKDK